MQKYLWQYISLIFMSIMILTGCAGIPLQEIDRMISDAQEGFDLVESLEVQDKYPADYQEAHDELVNAKTYYDSLFNRDKAYSSAKRSWEASQRILKQFYQNTITPLAQTAKAEIEKISTEDPDNPLKDFLPRLNDLLEYCEKLESGQEVVHLTRVIEDLNEVITIKRNADKNVKIELESDVSFDTGKYELSEEGKRILKEFFERIIADQKAYLDQYIGKTITMKIKVVGYTDQQGFRKGTDLIKTLLEGVKADQIPQSEFESRKFLNQRLSQLRANTIGEYIKQLIEQADPRIAVEQEIVGRGEEIPPGVAPPSSPSDSLANPKRRICKIYSSYFTTR
jgi:outer membrane protein OmpA-like peptidoglycan-associated protein